MSIETVLCVVLNSGLYLADCHHQLKTELVSLMDCFWWSCTFLGRVKSWSAPLDQSTAPMSASPMSSNAFAPVGAHPQKETAFLIWLFPTQLIGSCLFSSTINNMFHCSNFMSSVAQTSRITKNSNFLQCFLPSCWMTSYITSQGSWMRSIGSTMKPWSASVGSGVK